MCLCVWKLQRWTRLVKNVKHIKQLITAKVVISSSSFPNLSPEKERHGVRKDLKAAKACLAAGHAAKCLWKLEFPRDLRFPRNSASMGLVVRRAGFILGANQYRKSYFKGLKLFVVYLRSKCYFSFSPTEKISPEARPYLFFISTQKKRDHLAPTVKDRKIWRVRDILVCLFAPPSPWEK